MNSARKTVLTIAATATVTAGTTIGILYATGTLAIDHAPPTIVESCRLFMTAYDDAAAEAKKQNNATLQTELAHPVRVADIWKAKHQAAAEAAAIKVQYLTGDWGNVAWRIVEAATMMKPDNVEGLAQKDNALSAAQAACVGR